MGPRRSWLRRGEERERGYGYRNLLPFLSELREMIPRVIYERRSEERMQDMYEIDGWISRRLPYKTRIKQIRKE